MSQRLLLLAIAGIAFLWATRNWRKATEAALVLLVLEGAIRKWVFPGSQQLVYFAKDVLLIGCYIGFFTDRRARRQEVAVPPILVVLLSLAAAWAALEIFNPNLPNLLVGIFGFKAYFLYVPLMIVVPACYADDRSLARFVSRYALLAIPVGLLGLLQFASPASSTLNTYARPGVDDNAFIATFGSSQHVRVTGTFSFITGYTTFLLAIVILLLALLGSSGWRFSNRKLYVALGLTLLGMLMSGSRGPVFLLAALFPFYWYLGVLRERDAGGTVGRAVLAIGVVAAALVWFGGDALNAFIGRATSASGDVQERLLAPLLAPLRLLPEVGIFGFGIGASHPAAAAVAPSIVPYSWLRGLMTEGETGKIMLELGPVGFTLIYLARLVLLVTAFRHAQKLRTRFHRSLAIAAFLFFLAQIPGSPVFDVVSAVYFWYFAGLLMLAVRLDTLAVLRAREASASPQPAARHATPRPATPAPAWQSPLARRS
jgi:hypothetical protein